MTKKGEEFLKNKQSYQFMSHLESRLEEQLRVDLLSAWNPRSCWLTSELGCSQVITQTCPLKGENRSLCFAVSISFFIILSMNYLATSPAKNQWICYLLSEYNFNLILI